jgi:Zn ribbon nucleic-acid-binding protein
MSITETKTQHTLADLTRCPKCKSADLIHVVWPGGTVNRECVACGNRFLANNLCACCGQNPIARSIGNIPDLCEACAQSAETKTQQWTPAAMRAARILAANGYGDGFPEQLQVVASTISAETHDAEMAELLRDLIRDSNERVGIQLEIIERTERLLSLIGGQE